MSNSNNNYESLAVAEEAESWMLLLQDLEEVESAPPLNLAVNLNGGATQASTGSASLKIASTSTNSNGRRPSDESAIGKPKPPKKRAKLGEKKRLQRNAREQFRSQQLTQQFEQLKDALLQAGVQLPASTPSGPSKVNILKVTCDYIQALHKQLQSVDQENVGYKQILQRQGMNNQGYHSVEATTCTSSSPNPNPTIAKGVSLNESSPTLHGSAYKSAFQSLPSGVVSPNMHTLLAYVAYTQKLKPFSNLTRSLHQSPTFTGHCFTRWTHFGYQPGLCKRVSNVS